MAALAQRTHGLFTHGPSQRHTAARGERHASDAMAGPLAVVSREYSLHASLRPSSAADLPGDSADVPPQVLLAKIKQESRVRVQEITATGQLEVCSTLALNS